MMTICHIVDGSSVIRGDELFTSQFTSQFNFQFNSLSTGGDAPGGASLLDQNFDKRPSKAHTVS